MRKHIYLHTSNLEYIRDLRDDNLFQCPSEYDLKSVLKSHRNEYGRIKTNQNYYHILVGTIKQEGCPWCGYSVSLIKLKELTDGMIMLHSRYCMQCNNCGARGPILNVNQVMEGDKILMETIESAERDRFELRRPWDENLLQKDEK